MGPSMEDWKESNAVIIKIQDGIQSFLTDCIDFLNI
jgi:hypothetical protein